MNNTELINKMTLQQKAFFMSGKSTWETVSYEELQRVTNWRHPSNNRVGVMPAYQFVGKGEDRQLPSMADPEQFLCLRLYALGSVN